jgi:hypothetical protein
MPNDHAASSSTPKNQRQRALDRKLDEKYAVLFRLASDALGEEDRALRRRFSRARGAQAGAYADVAHGLTYWLFETTLVYTVFKRWLADHPVGWEHATRDRRPSSVVAKGSRPKCDLVVFSDWTMRAPEAAIEAKWWNDGSTKGTRAILKDVAKLRRNYGDPVRRYLLTFWWGREIGFAEDLDRAERFCDQHGLVLASDVASSRFKTRLPGGELGYFAVAGIRCH